MIVSREWAWFRSLRWGRSNFGACLWWICSPFGQFIIADEYKFQQQSPATVAAEIRKRDAELGMRFRDGSENLARYTAAEPRLWVVERGPSTAELFARASLPLMRSSDDRVQGWTTLTALLEQTITLPNGEVVPALVIADHCSQLRRLLPLLREGQGTGKDAREDIDTKTEASLVEALRIGAMSRPASTEISERKPGPDTMGHALELARQAATEDDAQYFG